MKRIISFLLLSVYFAFVAGSLSTSGEHSAYNDHGSEFKGKLADAKKIQKHLAFSGKIKLTRPHNSSEFFDSSLSVKKIAPGTANIKSDKRALSATALYLKNCILLI